MEYGMNVKKLLALKAPCKNCPFLKENGIELVEGRLDSIKEDLINNDETPFFCHKTTYSSGGFYDEETEAYVNSGQESYCMGAMAYLYAKNRLNVPTRIGLVMGMCDIEDIKNTIPFIKIE
ncbi:hypothetical protein BFL53_003974 [Escherichia coli]|nr:hypothetical protein [Escherichia coli]